MNEIESIFLQDSIGENSIANSNEDETANSKSQIERQEYDDVETGASRKIAAAATPTTTTNVRSDGPDDSASDPGISRMTSSRMSSQQSQWMIDSGIPSHSDRAKQKEYNKNLAAATVAALSKNNKMAISGRGSEFTGFKSKSMRQKENESRPGSVYRPPSQSNLFNARISSASGNRTLSALWSHPWMFRRQAAVVLVNLQLLNIARENQNNNNSSSSNNNNIDSIDWNSGGKNGSNSVRNPTTVPVNKFGFPAGLGRNEDERSGPHLYVACIVKNFQQGSSVRVLSAASSSRTIGDDDFATSYCTVERCDTGTLQVVRSDWEMDLLEDAVAIRAAMAAARGSSENFSSDGFRKSSTFLSVISSADDTNQTSKATALFANFRNEFKSSMTTKVIHPLRKLKLATKTIATQIVQGNAPFSCKVRITGVLFLSVCSTLFLFLESFRLGWLPHQLDYNFAVLETVIWFVLVFELIFEVLIRPSDYQQLIQSDKAYRPSTARYINQLFLVGETFALLAYFPQIICINITEDVCYNNSILWNLTVIQASVTAIVGPTRTDSATGRLILGFMAFRFFGVIRHWKLTLIRQTFSPIKRQGIEKWIIPYDPHRDFKKHLWPKIKEKKQDDEMTVDSDLDFEDINLSESKENQRLKSAANIGTALITVNCQRALILMVCSVVVLPIIFAISSQNLMASNLTKLLQAENLVSTTRDGDCEYLELVINSWLNTVLTKPSTTNDNNPFVLWAQVLPVRCPFQNPTGVITSCTKKQSQYFQSKCEIWDGAPLPDLNEDNKRAIQNYYAETLDLRGGGIVVDQQPSGPFQFEALGIFNVTVIYNQNPTIEMTNRYEFVMLIIVFFTGLGFLVWLQNDVNILALNPIQRMLRIVIRYAENPLSGDVDDDDNSRKSLTRGTATDDIGNIETEQLLNAITKISDLLRKCWGVAGAGIISSNLGRDKDGQVAVFNPTVPGKQVYALFGFVALRGYSELLTSLDRDVMILINDIAKVVHDEVYRWALGDHGQCNKNLGQAFFMVWRIGDFSEVQKKNKAAIEKMFRDKIYRSTKNNSNLRRRTVRTLNSRRNTALPSTSIRKTSTSIRGGRPEIQLESLPGIQGFADRALLGMLKSFASIHRDRSLQRWKNDSRLRKSSSMRWTTPSYTVEVMYGMDAGWAVEGAVGSIHKVDATYLSPHVNMASRMMSASKQYGVTILLSKAVEKLLSKQCRSKLRNLDRVYVKGSAVKQSIYTYDARYSGVNFFLLEKTPEQADRESDSYTPAIWDQDQDLVAMRRHVTEDFLVTYHRGLNQYLAGDWADAYQAFEQADEIMIRTVLEEGYIEIADDEMLETVEDRILDKNDKGDDVVRLRKEFGDGACRTLMNYIKRRNFEAPTDWDGVRQLSSK